MTRGKRILVGCAIGCGGLLVLVIALIVAFSLWIDRRGELLEPRTLLGADTTGYVEWRLRLEDPGTEGFVRRLITVVQEAPAGGPAALPDWLLGPLAERRAREVEQDVLELLPLVLAWTIQPGAAAEEDLHLVTLSIERFGNRMVFADWIMGLVLRRVDGALVERHGGEKIYRVPLSGGRQATFFMRGAHLFVASNLETARTAVERLGGATPGVASSGLGALLAETEEQGPLRGAVTGERGELARLWQLIAEEQDGPLSGEALGDLRAVTLAGGLREDGSLDTILRFHGPDAAWAEARAPDLAMELEQLVAARGELTPELRARPDGAVVEVSLHLADVLGALSHWLERAGAQQRAGGVTVETESTPD